MTIKEIRADLKAIRYYYSRKESLEAANAGVSPNVIVEQVQKYNMAIKEAPIRLYDVYIGLYIESNTIESLAGKWGYSTDVIKRLNRRLCAYFQKKFE